jgi:ABC-type antimicrobial peptide transport system permease subunit
MVRTSDGRSIVPSLRELLMDMNPNMPIINVQSIQDLIGIGLLPARIGAWAAITAGLAGALLACIGVYGVMAFSVAARAREIGVRSALGAERWDILKVILREGIMLASAGILLGTSIAVVLTRFISGFLFGVAPVDAAAYLGGSLLLAATTLLAAYIPARRATRITPIRALRYE